MSRKVTSLGLTLLFLAGSVACTRSPQVDLSTLKLKTVEKSPSEGAPYCSAKDSQGNSVNVDLDGSGNYEVVSPLSKYSGVKFHGNVNGGEAKVEEYQVVQYVDESGDSAGAGIHKEFRPAKSIEMKQAKAAATAARKACGLD